MKNIKSPDVILSYNHSIIVYSTGKTRKHLLLLAHPHPKFILRNSTHEYLIYNTF
jgi:hypothetical protein